MPDLDLSYSVRMGERLLQSFPVTKFGIHAQRRLVKSVGDISFSTTIFGGYDKASFTTSNDIDALTDYAEALGRDVAIYDGLGIQVWEGFVNAVTVSFGRAQYHNGPLMETVNRVKLRYTTPRFGTTPPQGGIEKETEFFVSNGVNGLSSRKRYGILSEIIVAPRSLADWEAASLAPELAETLAQPQGQIILADSGDAKPKAMIECLGYFHLTKKLIGDYYGYNGTAPAQPAWTVLTYPFSHETLGFFSLSGVVPYEDGPKLRLYNDQAESVHAFLETQYSIANSYRDMRFMMGVYNNRTLHFSRVMPGRKADIQLSIYGGVVGAIGTSGMIARPGMFAQLVDVPFALHAPSPVGFIIDNIEYSGGNLSFNAGTFSAIDEALRERGV